MTWEYKELYDQQKADGRDRKSRNKDWSTKHLAELEIPFTSHNEGVHLVVAEMVDFWPSTGKWMFRNGKSVGRGIKPLIKELRKRGVYEPK